MKLVIVESPTKAKTIGRFLGDDYVVESSYGHVRDLPKSKLGIDTENNFEPHYIIPTKAKKNVTHLKKEAKKAESIILATDEDREGEAIAWHLVKALGLDEDADKKSKVKNIERIVFHEITKSAIEQALKNPRLIDTNLVNAQQARRALDRLVGYKISPFLWKKVARGLSAGRVQSVAVRLIVERENEIRGFKPEEYWTIMAQFINGFDAELSKIDGKTLDKFAVQNENEADKIVVELKKQNFVIAAINKKINIKNPLPPFITSTLQQESVKRLGYSSKKTMFIAQRLYERGLITYMRTDSVNLSQEALTSSKAWLEKEYGTEYAVSAPRVFTGKSKLAQEAHEAIRPTNIGKSADELEDESDKKLYRLIWQRFVASQMPPAKVAVTSVEVAAGSYTLKTSGQQIVFDGYLKVWPQKFAEKTLPELREGQELELKDILPEQHFTEPPARYSEASLIKTLEEYGIGRPSTYAPIISVIQLRNYVKKEKGRFFPTEIGEIVNKVLTEHFPEIVDVDFTAKIETTLDEVAEGKEKWQDVMGAFYGPFSKNLEAKYEEVSKDEVMPVEQTDEKCEKCGKPMIIKYGRFGKFMACSGFPDCKTTKQLPKEAPKKIGMKCPRCNEGEIVERRVTRGRARGKIFWGCENYPKCDYASWTNPLNPPEEKSKEKKLKPEQTEDDKPVEELEKLTEE